MGEAIKKDRPEPGDQIKVKIEMAYEGALRAPSYYSNYAEVRMGMEEIVMLIAMRNEFSAEYEGDSMTVQAQPQAMITMSKTTARAFAKIILGHLDEYDKLEAEFLKKQAEVK
jgi:hypothetical protein